MDSIAKISEADSLQQQAARLKAYRWVKIVKLDFWIHPVQEELSVSAKVQSSSAMCPLVMSNQQPTVDAKNSKPLFDILSCSSLGKLYL